MNKPITMAVGYAAHGVEWVSQGSGGVFSVGARDGKPERAIEVHVLFDRGLPREYPNGIDFKLTGPRGTAPIEQHLTEKEAGKTGSYGALYLSTLGGPGRPIPRGDYHVGLKGNGKPIEGLSFSVAD